MLSVYLIHVEPEGDFFFTPEGVLITLDNISYQVYCLDSRHNFLRAAVTKFPLAQLTGDGVMYRGANIKLEPLQSLETNHDKAKEASFTILEEIYRSNPERYFFLSKYVRYR